MVDHKLSKSQLDRLGERLRDDHLSEDDLRALDDYRRSFNDDYEYVVGIITNRLKLNPTGRPAKSTTSIRDKLKRESIRLSQMQDIAGCRVVVSNIISQNEVVDDLAGQIDNVKLFDRRLQPSHGYRAVHLIAHHADKPVEIQVRSNWQHGWAELSEKAADVIDPAVKYGCGPEALQRMLLRLSETINAHENNQLETHLLKILIESIAEKPPLVEKKISKLERRILRADSEMGELLTSIRSYLSK